MVIVSKDNIPVACYDDVSPEEALRAYLDEILPGSIMANIIIDSEGSAIFEFQVGKYDAVIYLDNF